MKRIAILVAGAFLLQQFAPSLLWAGALENAVGGADSSYELTGDYSVEQNIPAFGTKADNTFTVNGENHTLNGGTYNGFSVSEGETLHLNNLTLNGFSDFNYYDEEEEKNGVIAHVSVYNDGTVIANNVVSNTSILTPGLQANPKGEVQVVGNFDSTHGALFQNKVTVAQGGTLTIDVGNLNAETITNDGTLNVGGSLEEGERNHFSTDVTGDGVLNIIGEVKADSAETITQGQVNVQSGATLENLSTVTAQITNENKIINTGNGQLYTKGTSVNNGQIIGDEYSKGSLTVASGTLTNTGKIDQTGVTINQGAKLTTILDDDHLSTNEPFITNDGTLEVTGGSNTRTIKDSVTTQATPGTKGTLLVTNDFENALGATIQQQNVEVATGKTFTQNGNMYAALTNKGTTINDGSEFRIYGGSNTGTIENTAVNNGGFKLMGGTFDNRGTITQGGVEISEGATLKTAADTINVYNDTSFKNDGTLVLTGGTNTNHILMSDDTETGVTHIAGGKVTNNGLIKQSGIYIDAATETTAAGHLVTATDTITNGADLFADYVEIHNDGELTFTGTGASDGNAHTLTGTGTLHINGESGTVVNNYGGATITQGNLTVAANNTFGALGYVTVTDTLTNEGTLNTSGQTQVGTLLNKGSTFVDGGLTVTSLDNRGLLSTGNGVTVTDGTNTGTIQTGELRIQGQFDNTGEGMITQNKIDIDHGAQFTTAADKVGATLRNAGTLILTGSEDGLTNNNNIIGGSSDYPSNLIIRDGKVINTEGKNIEQNNIVVAAADTQKGTAAGEFEAHAKDLNGDLKNHAKVTLWGVNDNWEDADNALQSTTTGEGDLYIRKTVVAEREITQGSLNLEGNEEINQFYNLKNGHVQADINTAETARIYNHGTITITGGENKGNILDNREAEEKAEGEQVYLSKLEISGGKFTNTGMIKQDVINVMADGEFETAQNTLILPEDGQISNNGILTITGDGEGGSALRVGKNDQWEGPAKTVITGALDDVARIYQDTLFITKDGSLEMDIGDDYSNFNVGTILNNGTFTLTGGTIQQNINYDTTQENDSKLVISTGGVKVANEDIVLTQKEIAVGENGEFFVKAEQLVADKVINDGILKLNGGTNTNKMDGNGELSFTEDVINNAHVDQRKVVVDGGVKFTHSGTDDMEQPYVLKANVENDGTVQNDAIITAMNDESQEDPLSRSSVNHEGALFTGKGTLRVGGNFYNEGTLQQNAVVVLAQGDEEGMTQAGHFITDVDSVKADITNNGLLTLASGVTGINTNTIDGDNGTLELAGNITNNGSITQLKVDTKGNTLTNNGQLSFKEAGANNNIVGSGDMEITGEVTQQGNLQQGSLTVAEGASFRADFDNLSVNKLTNDGTLVAYQDATIRTNIADTAQDGSKGRFEVRAKTYNEGNIIQKEVFVEDNKSFFTAADKVTATSSFDNEGTLILTSGENKNNITGNGKVEIYYNTITNSGSITQQGLNVSDEATFTTALGENALQVATLTNNGVLNLSGGTLSQEIGQRDGAQKAQTNIIGDVTVDGGSFNQKAVTVEQGGTLNAGLDGLTAVATFTNDGTFNVSGAEFNRALSGSGELVIAGTMENTNTADNAITQGKVTVNNKGVFTTAATTLKADIVNNGTLNLTGGTNNNAITNNATLAFQGGTEDAAMLNNKAIAGNGTLNIEGVVENAQGQSIANSIAIASGKSLTAYANDILGNVTNSGTLKFNGGTIQQAALVGNTQIVGDVALAQDTTFDNVFVTAGKSLNMNTAQVTATDMAIDGTLGMSIGGLAKDSADYTGAKLTLGNKLTLGSSSKLLITVLSGDLQTDEQTDWLTLVEGNIDGTWDGVLSQNTRYEITRDEDNQGKVKLTYKVSAGEAAQEAGANKNEAAVADAWDEVAKDVSASPVAQQVATNISTLSQDVSRKQEYVEALESLAPVQVAMTKANVSNLNQGIYTVANNHMSGGVGMAAGEMFSYKSVWMQGMFNNTKYDVEGGFDGNTYGGAIGLDVSHEDETTLGIGYAYAYSSLNATGKKIKADTQNVFLYGNYTGLENWYFDGTLGYNFGSYKEDKTVTGVTGRGKYHVNSLAAQAMAQYTVNEYLSPLAGLRYVYAHQGAYTDGFSQTIGTTNDHTLTALLGAKVGRNFQAGKLVLKPLFRLAATYDVMQHGDDVTVTMTNSSYKIESEQLKKFGVETGLSLGMDLTNQLELTFGYDGQFRSHYYNHTGSAKLKYSF